MLLLAMCIAIISFVANNVFISVHLLEFILVVSIVSIVGKYYRVALVLLVFSFINLQVNLATSSQISNTIYAYTNNVIVDKISINKDKYQLLVRFSDGYFKSKRASVGCNITDNICSDIVLGGEYRFKLNLYPIQNTSGSYLENYDSYQLSNDIVANGSVQSYTSVNNTNDSKLFTLQYIDQYRNSQINYLHNTFLDNQYAGILIALLTGYQNYITPNLWQIFQQTNVIHVVSVSGVHLTIFAFSLWLLIAYCLRIFRYSSYKVSVLDLSIYITCVASFLYAYFCGMSMPTVRGLLSIYLLGLFGLAKSYFDKYDIYAIGLILTCILLPFSTISLGFYLSFGVVLLIFIIVDYVKIRNKWLKLLFMQICISVFSLMIVHYYNGTLATYSILANILVLFGLNFILPIGLVAMIFHLNWLLLVLLGLLKYTVIALGYIAHLPLYNLAVPNFSLLLLGILGMLFCVFPSVLRLQKALGLCLILFSILAVSNPLNKVVWVNDSNYMLNIIQYKHQNILFVASRSDTQNKDIDLARPITKVNEILAKLGINKLNYVLTESRLYNNLESELSRHRIYSQNWIVGESVVNSIDLSVIYAENSYTLMLGNELLSTSDIENLTPQAIYTQTIFDAKGYRCKDIDMSIFGTNVYIIGDYYWNTCEVDDLYYNDKLIDLSKYSDYELR